MSSPGVDGEPTQAETAQALVDGFQIAWLGCALFLAAGAVLLFALLRRGDVLAVAEGEAPAIVKSPLVEIAPFRIEEYYAVHEFAAPHMLSSSDAESVAIADVLALEPDAAERLFAQRLGYTESAGAPELRAAAAALYETHVPRRCGSSSRRPRRGIFAAYHALLQPGDHVVVETPCYESALQLARSTGAVLTEWRRSAADDWAHDLDAFEAALRPNTRLVYINTPHNPTGLSHAARGARSGRRALRRTRGLAVRR